MYARPSEIANVLSDRTRTPPQHTTRSPPQQRCPTRGPEPKVSRRQTSQNKTHIRQPTIPNSRRKYMPRIRPDQPRNQIVRPRKSSQQTGVQITVQVRSFATHNLFRLQPNATNTPPIDAHGCRAQQPQPKPPIQPQQSIWSHNDNASRL